MVVLSDFGGMGYVPISYPPFVTSPAPTAGSLQLLCHPCRLQGMKPAWCGGLGGRNRGDW